MHCVLLTSRIMVGIKDGALIVKGRKPYPTTPHLTSKPKIPKVTNTIVKTLSLACNLGRPSDKDACKISVGV